MGPPTKPDLPGHRNLRLGVLAGARWAGPRGCVYRGPAHSDHGRVPCGTHTKPARGSYIYIYMYVCICLYI